MSDLKFRDSNNLLRKKLGLIKTAMELNTLTQALEYSLKKTLQTINVITDEDKQVLRQVRLSDMAKERYNEAKSRYEIPNLENDFRLGIIKEGLSLKRLQKDIKRKIIQYEPFADNEEQKILKRISQGIQSIEHMEKLRETAIKSRIINQTTDRKFVDQHWDQIDFDQDKEDKLELQKISRKFNSNTETL